MEKKRDILPSTKNPHIIMMNLRPSLLVISVFFIKLWSTKGAILERDTTIRNQPVIIHLHQIISKIVVFQFLLNIYVNLNPEISENYY